MRQYITKRTTIEYGKNWVSLLRAACGFSKTDRTDMPLKKNNAMSLVSSRPKRRENTVR